MRRLIIYLVFDWMYRCANWYQVILPAYPLVLLGVAAAAERVQVYFELQGKQWAAYLPGGAAGRRHRLARGDGLGAGRQLRPAGRHGAGAGRRAAGPAAAAEGQPVCRHGATRWRWTT